MDFEAESANECNISVNQNNTTLDVTCESSNRKVMPRSVTVGVSTKPHGWLERLQLMARYIFTLVLFHLADIESAFVTTL